MKRPAAFIDLQGTLGGTGTDDISTFKFFDCAYEAIHQLNINGIYAIVITNQSNIVKGLLSWDEYINNMHRIINELMEHGVHLDDMFCCPHSRADNCDCKKPKTKLIQMAYDKYDIDLARQYVIGDMAANDIVLANNITAKGILVLTGTGRGSIGEYRHTWEKYEADYVADDILCAVKWLINDIK